NLIAFEKLRQLVLILRDDACKRNSQVITKCEVCLSRCFVFSSAQDLEDEFVAFFSVLAEQRFDVLKRGCFQRFEAVAYVHTTDHIDHVFTASDFVGKEISRASWRLR